MANLRRRVQGGTIRWQVRWVESEKARSQTFVTKKEATLFKGLVDAAGQRLPEGWLPGVGFAKPAAAGSPKLKDWFTEAIGSHAKASASTRKDNLRDFTNHVPSWLAEKPINEITAVDVGNWMVWLQEPHTDVNGKKHKGLAAKTIHNIHGTLSSVMKDAQADGLLTRNPFAGKSKATKPKHEQMTFLTPEEFDILLAQIPDFYKSFITFLFGTGLRFAEATALKVEHVDLANSRIFITTAWKRMDEGPDQSLEPKTDYSRRTLSLTPRQVELLRPLVAGRRGDELVFVNKYGSRINNGTFYNAVWNRCRNAALAAGLQKKPRIHDLRHSYASLLISAGHPMMAVSRRLGHATTDQTDKRYGHLSPKVDTAGVDLLSQAGL